LLLQEELELEMGTKTIESRLDDILPESGVVELSDYTLEAGEGASCQKLFRDSCFCGLNC
jgi:hypothetical protein